MKIVYTDIAGPSTGFDRYKYMALDELLSVADFVSLHIPFSKELGAVVGKKQFELMKDGSYIINCARGGVVDEDALIEALDSGKLAGAAVDVYVEEPTKNERLYKHEKVSVTPHIGASTNEAQERIGEEVVQIITKFFE
jgi:D-3-phosphoglycerate dehydrogenase